MVRLNSPLYILAKGALSHTFLLELKLSKIMSNELTQSKIQQYLTEMELSCVFRLKCIAHFEQRRDCLIPEFP